MTDINNLMFPEKKDGDIALGEDGKYYQYNQKKDLWEEIDNPNE